VTYSSNQRAGNGSGVVVMAARCMPVTVAPGPRPPHPDFPRPSSGSAWSSTTSPAAWTGTA